MMDWKIPKDTKEFEWTNHVVGKMRQYRLSEQKVRSVIFRHKRKEEGIAPKTIAVMQPAGSKNNPTEIWVMYQVVKQGKKKTDAEESGWKAVLPKLPRKRIITAWRYPGVSPVRNAIPIPQDIAEELDSII